MKELNELNLPPDLRYSESHEWVQAAGEKIKIGLSDYAQDQLGDIVYVELPQVGDSFNKGDEFGTVESVKAVSELYMPIGGEIVAINTAMEDNPELVNNDPYGDGWLLEVAPADAAEIDSLLTHTAYLDQLKG